jgi:predicted  nucleic acid-binding Zn-ribbon protein
MLNLMRRALSIREHEEVDMEGRIARLESDVAHIRTDVADMKADIRDLRSKMDTGFADARSNTDDLRNKMDAGFADVRNKMEAGFTEVRQSIAQLSVALEKVSGKSSVTSLETRVWGLIMIGGVLFVVARGLKWI